MTILAGLSLAVFGFIAESYVLIFGGGMLCGCWLAERGIAT